MAGMHVNLQLQDGKGLVVLCDVILDGADDPMHFGCRVILPSTFTGGPHYMHEHQPVAVSYIRKYGHPVPLQF